MNAEALTKVANNMHPQLSKYLYIKKVGPGAEHIQSCCWGTPYLTGLQLLSL